jgi:hypothetical protein
MRKIAVVPFLADLASEYDRPREDHDDLAGSPLLA